MKWAREQRTGGPGAQLLLLELGLNASDLGTVVDLSIPRLADVTRQSRRTVSRLLAELEGLGALERADAYDGTGGRRVIVKLKLDCVIDEATFAERTAMTTSDSEETAVSDEPKNETETGEGRANLARPRSRQTAHEVVPNSASGRANGDTTPLYTNLEESLSNASASGREGERERVEEFRKRLDDDWKRFCLAYPTSVAMDLTAAKRELGALKLGDRDQAIRFAADYAAEIKAAKRSFPKEAWRWLADRDFDRIAELRQVRAEKVGLKAPPVTVRKGTPAGDAWEKWHREHGKPSVYWPWSRELNCHVRSEPTLFPPGETQPVDPPESSTGPPERSQSDEGDVEE